MNNTNWLCDGAPRVPRTIETIVEEAKEDAVGIWKRISDVLDRALMAHPEARWVVLRAIEEEFITREGG